MLSFFGKLYSSREDDDQSVVLILSSFTDSSLDVIGSPFFGPNLYRFFFLFFFRRPAFTAIIFAPERSDDSFFFLTSGFEADESRFESVLISD
jgi:hypothetical protein